MPSQTQTRDNIKAKRKIKAKKRRLKIFRLFIFMIIAGIFLCAFGWLAAKAYNKGSEIYAVYVQLYDEYKQRRSLREASFDSRFDGYTNFLIVGLDEGKEDWGQQADSFHLLSFNNETGEVRLLTIPRYTITDIPGRPQPERLSNAYYYGGISLTEQTINQMLDVTIHHYVIIDIKVLADIIDLLGGIDVYVEGDMDYDDPEADLHIHIKKGYQHMNGDTAQKYLRFSSDELGGVGRVQRQQHFIKSLYERLLNPDVLTALPQIVQLCQQKVTTTAEIFDTVHLTNILRKIPKEAPKAMMLPGCMSADGSASWIYDKQKTAEKMQELFPADAPENGETTDSQ